ncbi:SapB/AmfS family lanthipeptide [Streptomyces spiramyceticus]|nr:SapB/AmfS family lanthipeptide [Streptomyces spiramyceticus]
MALLELQAFEPDVVAHGSNKSKKRGGSSFSTLLCGHQPSNLSLTLCSGH